MADIKTFSGAYEMYCLDLSCNLNELPFTIKFLKELTEKGYLYSLPKEKHLVIIEKHHAVASKALTEVYEAINKYNLDRKTYLWPQGSSVERDTIVELYKEGYLPQLPDEVSLRIIEGLPLDASAYSRFERLKEITESRSDTLIPKPERQFILTDR